MRLQFKSVTRRADSDKYIAGLKRDLEQEEVAACRALGEGTIRFIREEGSREALSRRFFLIFQYEAVSRRQADADYSEIYAALQTAAQNARSWVSGWPCPTRSGRRAHPTACCTGRGCCPLCPWQSAAAACAKPFWWAT